MEPNKFEVISVGDRDQRNRMFHEFRNGAHHGERQAVRFTQTEETEPGVFKTMFYVAHPKHSWKQNHGSARNPRKFPGRKKA